MAIRGSGGGPTFKTINVGAGTDPEADSLVDVLNITSSDSSVTITGNAATDTIDFTAAGATVTLQGAYNNGVDGIIIVDSTNGPVAIQDAATPTAGTLFSVSNNGASTDYLIVNATDTYRPGVGTDSVVYGINSTSAADRAVVIGHDADAAAAADGAVVIGSGASAAGGQTGALAIGEGATATETFGSKGSIAIGGIASTTGLSPTATGSIVAAFALGAGATSTGILGSMAIGDRASATGTAAGAMGLASQSLGTNSTAIGGASICGSAAASSIAFGYTTSSYGSGSVVFGSLASNPVGHNQCFVLGNQAASTGPNQLVLGSTAASLVEAYLGEGVKSANASTEVTFNTTGASGANNIGSDFVVASGRPTGSGDPGHLALKTPKTDYAPTFVDGDVSTGAETITINGHLWKDRDQVEFTTTGTLPSPLATGTTYYIISATANDFQVSTSEGGSAVDITSAAGGGTHTVIPRTNTGQHPLIERYRANETEVIMNDPGEDYNLRIETVNLEYGLFVDAGNDAVIVGGDETTFTVEGASWTGRFGSEIDGAGNIVNGVWHRHGGIPETPFIRTGGTHASQTAVADNDTLGNIPFCGHDGTDINTGAAIAALVDGTVSANTVPTELIFQTSATNSAGLTTALNIKPNQDVEIPNGELNIGGDTGGLAAHNTITGATDTPTTDPGWTTSSTVDMNAPSGYMKAYVGTQAVVIPYWNT